MASIFKIKQLNPVIIFFLLVISTASAQDFIFSPINVQQGLSDNQIRYILQLQDGRMVFKTSGNINIYDATGFKYIHQRSEDVYPLRAYNGFYRIYLGHDSTLWIKDTQRLMRVNLRTEKYSPNLHSYFKQIGFKKNVDDFFMDSDQRFWLLSERKLELADHSKSIHIANQQGTLQDVASTKENIYLFYSTGLVTCHNLKNESSFSAFAYPSSQQSKFERTSLVVRQGNGFYQLRNGSKGGFFFFDIKKRIWETILETDYTLNTLTFDASGKAYISCTNGIWIIDHKKGEKQYIPTLKKRDGNLLNTEISTVFHDRQGGLWLGTLNQGLLYYHPARYIFKHIGKAHFPKAYVKEIIVQLFAADEVGNIYLKCNTEIYRYRPSVKDDNLLEAVTLYSLPKNVANKFKQPISAHTQLTDSRGWKWTATADGLKLLETKLSKERTFYTSDGLSNNFIHAIFQDSKHQIWITTSYGINKVQINTANKKISFLSFGADVGTLDGEYTDGAVFEHTDGTLYFGGINGFTILEPKSPDVKNLPFKPVFTNLFLRGEKVEARQTYDGLTLLSKIAPYTKTITLLHHQNFLNFEFSGLNYQNPLQTYYRYQLEGIDKQWRETKGELQLGQTNKNHGLTLSYTNLPYGNYKLKVMASNNNQDWSSSLTVIDITILPPWWKTTLAITLFTIASLLLIFACFYFYARNSRKKMELAHREEVLLIRIRNLIEQQNFLEAEKAHQGQLEEQKNIVPSAQNQADTIFLSKALAHVEKHLNNPNYSVEQLSQDLHMDRTGLYRKLVNLLDKSPSLFIRNIRLEKAAEMLLEGKLNISEITDKIGFSSSSYFSKCFQEQYGCKPSEYAQKIKKST